MCGFLGYIVDQPNEVNDAEMQELKNMTNIITHRGPDDYGFYTDDYARLGFRRLSIIDIESGDQPFSYEDERYWMVFNGEIYNYIELREELKQQGFTFKTSSDTEVLIAMYQWKKEEMVHHLRGMFAFVIWDKEQKEIFAARDPFGIKPLYYCVCGGKIYFASEKKSIHKSQRGDIDHKALQHYFSYQYITNPYTLLDSIRKLEPGHFLKKKVGCSFKIQKYWASSFHPVHQSEAEAIGKIRDVLRDSVSMHMRSDVPLGSFLSGGIDSSGIVALAKELNPDIKTFTVGFERNGYSEIDVAKDTAAKLHVENIHHVITPEEFVAELPNIIWHMDEPVADPAAIPLYFVAKLAREHVKVVLSGEGADELFTGYNIYREPLALNWFSVLPSFVRNMIKSVATTLPDGVKGKSYFIRGCTPIEERYIGNAKIFTEQEKQLFYKPFDPNVRYQQLTKPFYDAAANYSDVHKMQYIDIHTWLSGDILMKADKMTMANSLELRVPFLDKEVFDVARTLDPKQNLANKTTKYLLRKALEGIVPDSVLYRKKLGFPVPIRHWLKAELYDWAGELIATSETDDLINKSYVLKLLQDHKQNKADHSRKIWTVLVFMIWHQLYIEDKYAFGEAHLRQTVVER